MFRFLILPVLAVVVGCASSSTELEDTRTKGLRVRRWSSVDTMQEFTDGHREVVFTHHLNRSLEEISGTTGYDTLDFAEAKMRAKLRAIERARPERRFVSSVITNHTEEELICRIYPAGSGKEFSSLRVPAGTTVATPLLEGQRYRSVWAYPDGRPTGWGREFNNPAFEGIREEVWYK